MHILEIDSVQKQYGDRSILTDIYLKCVTGDIIGFLGRNGTGKSTFLKIVFGVEDAGYCFIRLDGQKLDKPYQHPYQIAYLPQHDFLPKHLKVAGLVKLYLGKKQLDSFFDDDFLKSFQDQKVGQLSGGESRYLQIKLLLYLPNKFVLLDEPFNGVAPVMVDLLKELIKKHSAHKGIILTDHDYRQVLDVSTSICLLHDGCIKYINNKDDLIRWQYLSG